MPFKSCKQKGWMLRNEPKLAKKWTKKYGGKCKKGSDKGKK